MESTGAELYGELSVPVGVEGRAPALLLLPGSGAVDGDGNVMPLLRNSGYRQLAYALACHGFAMLRVAKLGIPPSTANAKDVTLQTFAHNTADWLALLADQPDIDPNRIGLLGHSEGGLIALYAVANQFVAPQVVALIATSGRPLDDLAREQIIARNQEAGATPEQLRAVGELLAAAATRATLLAFADLTHNLLDTSGPALDAMLPGPNAVISDTLVRALATYLNGYLRAAR